MTDVTPAVVAGIATDTSGVNYLRVLSPDDLTGLPGRKARAFTRLFDLSVALAALFVCLPMLLIIALLVKLTSAGPVLFRQDRLGRSGRIFSCLKYRTMSRDADTELTQLLQDNPALSREFSDKFKLRHDPRVTTIGRFLRATSLDELPQLFNILCGQMSVVGPRPIVEAERRRYGDQLDVVLRVKPGLTGLWQVSGRSDLTYEQRVALDAYYSRHRRLRDDIVICLRTVGVLLSRSGAY